MTAAHDEAVGWIISSAERATPGFLTEEAARANAAGHHDIALVITQWAHRFDTTSATA